MIDTSLIVDAALWKSQMLLDNLLSLDLLHEETKFENTSPRAEHAFHTLDAEQPPVHEPPAHVCEELTVQVPMETLQVLTEVFEQVQAWRTSSEQADALSPSLLGQPDVSKHIRDSELSSMISTEGSLCSSPRSSDSSLDLPGSPGLSSERPITSSLVQLKPDSVTVMTPRTWVSASCAGPLRGVPSRRMSVPAAPVSPRGSLRKAPAVVHRPQNVGSARCIAWHPVAVTTLHHALTVC